MNFLIYLKNVMIVIVIVHVIAILKKNNRKCVCLTDKYREFCEEYSIILNKTTRSYFNVEYIKLFYLLQNLLIKLHLKN